MRLKPATQLLILLTGVIWIAYDIFAYITWGTPATESATISYWAYYSKGFTFMFGVLIGHLFFQMDGPTAFPRNKS